MFTNKSYCMPEQHEPEIHPFRKYSLPVIKSFKNYQVYKHQLIIKAILNINCDDETIEEKLDCLKIKSDLLYVLPSLEFPEIKLTN